MNAFFGVTDNDWFAFLSQQPGIGEVNFWQLRPMGGQALKRNEGQALQSATTTADKKYGGQVRKKVNNLSIKHTGPPLSYSLFVREGPRLYEEMVSGPPEKRRVNHA